MAKSEADVRRFLAGDGQRTEQQIRSFLGGAEPARERPRVSLDVSPDLAADVTAVAPRPQAPTIDFEASERLGLRRPAPPALPAAERPPAAQVMAASSTAVGPQEPRTATPPTIAAQGESPLARTVAARAGAEEIAATEEFRAKPPILQDVARVAAGAARAPFVGAVPRLAGVDPEEQARIDPGGRGAVLRGAGTLAAVAGEILLTKGVAGEVARGVGPGVVRSGLELVAETKGGTAGRRAVRGALEGIPTDIGFGIVDPDLTVVESVALGSGIGAVGEVALPLVSRALRGGDPELAPRVDLTPDEVRVEAERRVMSGINRRTQDIAFGAEERRGGVGRREGEAGIDVARLEPGAARREVDPATDLARATATPIQANTPVRPEAPPVGSLPDPNQGGFFDMGAAVGVVRRFFKREFTSAGDLPEAVFRRKVSRDGWMSSQQTSVRNTLADFKRATRQAFGAKPNEAQLRQIDDVLKGDAPPESMPAIMEPVVRQMRDELDALSVRMIDTGLVEGELVAKVTDNLGSYTTRSYRVFDDPEWASKVSQDVRNKAKALLRSEMPRSSEEEIDGLIASLLYRIEDGPIALLSRGGKLGSKDLSTLKRRKDIAPEIRALWGEFRDPRVNYARSVTKMANAIANHEFLTDVRVEGLGGFFHERPVVIGGVEFKAQIAAEGSAVMAPLNGLYTTPEIDRAFKDALDPVSAGPWFRAYMKINSIVKYNKTVGSMMTHVRNTVGNTGFAVANGHVRVGEAGKALRAIATNIGRLDSPEWRAYYRKVQELGVVDQSPHAGELRAAIRDAMGKEGVDLMTDPGTSVVRRGLGVLTDLYRAEDDVWKVYAFENEKARYAKALPGMSESEIEQISARIVRDTYPTYSQIPRAVRAVRGLPLIGTFVSFPSEVFRVGYNTINLAMTELADPALRTIGAQRLAGVMVAATGTAAAAAASRSLTGVTKDMDEDMRRFLPPWSQNSDIIHLGRDEDGNMKFVDVSYTDPYSYLKGPVKAALSGEDWQSSLVTAAAEAFDPFLSEEILSERLIDIARNTTQTGGRVFNPADHPIRRFEDMAGHIYEALEPGTITSGRRIMMGITGTTTVYGRTYDPTLEALAVMTGHRMSILDVRQALVFRARDHSDNIRNSQRILTSVITRRGEVGQSEIARAFGGMQAGRMDAFDAAHEDAMAALRLGMTRPEVVQTFRAAGMSRANAAAVYTGDITQYRPTEALFGNVQDVIRAEGEDVGEAARRFNERRREISELIEAGSP